MGNVRYKVIEKEGQQIVEEIHKVVVHRFRMGDVEDPDLYASQPMYEWEKSEAGQFVMKHAVDTPEWHRHLDQFSYGHEYAIVAELEKKKLSEFYLRFDKTLIR
jgi:hypothetical protein